MNIVKGHAWKLGNSIDTDVITPTKYLSLPLEEMKKHALEPILPNFAGEVRPGDIIVAGANFGCGSSRETAVTALKALGVGAVVAVSFARIFFRNAIAQGLPILTCPEAAGQVDSGDLLELDVEKGILMNRTKNVEVQGVPLSKDMLAIIRKGGILKLLGDKIA